MDEIFALPTLVAGVTLLGLVIAGLELVMANRRLRRLIDQPAAAGSDLPTVSVVIPARNEAAMIEAALQSVLGQDYPRLEILVLDDRSTDDTGAILDRLVQAHPALRVIHVRQLPGGWLGKNHALYEGARLAEGTVLLFTDADIVMHPTAISRAVGYMLNAKADHLVVLPPLLIRQPLAQMVVGTFHLLGSLFAKPWRCQNPRSRYHVGIGAFNMVRTDAYRRAGTHRRIALRPDDDMKLGKILKQTGSRQHLLVGCDAISVDWYPSLRHMVAGLEKNAFAMLDYRLSTLALGSGVFLLSLFWPWVALFLTSGLAFGLNLAIVAFVVGLQAYTCRLFHRSPAWHALCCPLTLLIMLFILWRGTLLTLWKQRISWRDTDYLLSELRTNRV
jgi:cellulose synthase/poly-beta-1,6-N-acetylglucosamine synthase-like glycosyltransferase